MDVPKETLRQQLKRNIHGKVSESIGVLSHDEEDVIVETCQLCSEWGFGLTKVDVMNVVGEYFKNTHKSNPFKDGVPGEDWWKLFIKRHPQLAKKKPQALQMVRAKAATPEVINNWFMECLKSTLVKLNLEDKRVDESGFPLSGRPAQVTVKRGMMSPQSIIGGSGRENITLQYRCVSVLRVNYI